MSSPHAMKQDFLPSRHESRGPRANTHARAEVLRMLKEDHRVAKLAFREFDRLDAVDDAQACENLIHQTCVDLEVHTRLEEDVFYPTVRTAMSRDALIDDAEVEHQAMKMLLDQVRRTRPGDARQAASFRVLGEYVKHHVKEEEGELFRQLSHARLDWARLLDDMQAHRQRLINELDDQGATHLQHGGVAGIRQGLEGHGLRTGSHS
ncbi:MAG TPA: hemerythrin domain-containing protein [Candidatus Aquabacterium excrementipullorum]|nr:hemerythrin domain-containing protein [Candidatus Aquabacterium excrementipullorum]